VEAERAVAFTVYGKPQPAGSKRAFRTKRGGVAVTDDNPKAKPWQTAVAETALEQWDGSLLEGPLALRVIFYVARPKGHYGSGRNSAHVRPSAPPHPITRPDTSKLVRAVEDALTGALWRDDAQVVTQTALKRYGTPERAEVWIGEIE
jgi:Holliday junction resolvase RusA-like endonuclease